MSASHEQSASFQSLKLQRETRKLQRGLELTKEIYGPTIIKKKCSFIK
jgi:hypothetical protein